MLLWFKTVFYLLYGEKCHSLQWWTQFLRNYSWDLRISPRLWLFVLSEAINLFSEFKHQCVHSGAGRGWWRGSSWSQSKWAGQYFWLWPTLHTCWLGPPSSRYWNVRLRATTETTSNWRSWISWLIILAWTDQPWRNLFRFPFNFFTFI